MNILDTRAENWLGMMTEKFFSFNEGFVDVYLV